MRKIKCIVTFGQDGRRWAVGLPPGGMHWSDGIITEISEITKNGQMAPVPWFEIYVGDNPRWQVNATYVEYVEYIEIPDEPGSTPF